MEKYDLEPGQGLLGKVDETAATMSDSGLFLCITV
jgi:hypothetical protein